jgi:hypothetical protein
MLGRLDQVNEYKNLRWNEEVFSDECSVWLSTKSGQAWAERETNGRYFEPLHSPKVHIWAAIWRKGVVGFKIFTENLNSNRYIEIL